jgi:hypothetical protein
MKTTLTEILFMLVTMHMQPLGMMHMQPPVMMHTAEWKLPAFMADMSSKTILQM